MVELIDDLLSGLSSEEFGMFHHGRVDLFEAELRRGLPKPIEEPVSAPHVVGIEIPRTPRGLELAARVFLFLRLAHERVLPGAAACFGSAPASQGIPRRGQDARVSKGIATNRANLAPIPGPE